MQNQIENRKLLTACASQIIDTPLRGFTVLFHTMYVYCVAPAAVQLAVVLKYTITPLHP